MYRYIGTPLMSMAFLIVMINSHVSRINAKLFSRLNWWETTELVKIIVYQLGYVTAV